MRSAIRTHVAAALLLVPLASALVAQPAAAQHVVVAQPAIRALSLNSSAGVAPGAVLLVVLTATPGARATSLTLGPNGARVVLREHSAGNYVGKYTVRRTDRIDPLQLMTARASFGQRTIAQNFSFPPAFQALAMGAPAAAAATPLIDRFVMRPAGARLVPGRELRFRLVGAAGGDASLDIPGVVRDLELKETRPGVYEGAYTIRRRDDPDAFERAVATLRSGKQRATARLDLSGAYRDWGQREDARAPRISQVTPGRM